MEAPFQRTMRAPMKGWWRASQPKHAAATAGTPVEDKTTSLAFNALIGFTLILILAPQEQLTFLSPLHLAVVTSVVAAGAHIRDRMRRKLPIVARGPAVSFVLALGAWSLVTIPFSMWPSGSIDLFTSIYFKSIVIFLLLGGAIDTTTKLRKLAWALTLFAVPLAVTALYHYAAHDFIVTEGVQRIMGYPSGLGQNPNDLALLLNIILPISCGLFLAHKGAGGRLLIAAAIGLSAGAIVVTFSRAGFLNLALVFVLLGWKLRARKERMFVFAAVAVAVIALFVLLPSGYIGHLGTITNISKDATGSAQERSRDMLQALIEFGRRPIFGAGLGQNVLALNADRGTTWRMVHNVYLQYATDLGLPGLVLFLGAFVSCLSGLSKAVKKLRGEPALAELFDLSQGVQLSLFGFALAAFFHPVGYHFPFFYLAGLAVAARSISLRSA
jgi:O-antigen ligase